MLSATFRSAVLRHLRLAFSAACGGLCIAVIVFWVRSYWYADIAFVKTWPTEYIQVHAAGGRMCVWFEHKPLAYWGSWHSRPVIDSDGPGADNRIPWFNLAFWPTFARLYTAHWFLAVVAGSLATIPWFPRRFSLRTLLAALTVIATITAVIGWVDATF